MAVSGTLKLDRATFFAGSGAVASQRGDDNWGANYVFAHDGLQNDIYVVAEEFKNLSTSGAFATDAELLAVSGALNSKLSSVSGAITTNGTFLQAAITSGSFIDSQIAGAGLRCVSSGIQVIGQQGYPLAASGIFMNGPGNVPYRIVITADGLVSGVAV